MFNKMALFACWSFLSTAALAGDQVYSPIVEKAEWEFESRALFSHDKDPAISGAQNHVFEIGYGLTSNWATSLLIEVERSPGEKARATHLAWENIIQLTPQGKYWLDAGAYIELEKGLNGDANEIETKLLLEKQIGKIIVTLNPILKKNISVTDTPGVKFGYSWRTVYRLNRKLGFGFEGYGQLGEIRRFLPVSEQYHTIGPALLGRLPFGSSLFKGGHLKYDLAYLQGLTRGTPTSSYQLNLEYEVQF